ncbi:SNF1-related protein kinase regulatory subunit beta-2 [Quillaja saponaria]|uniref:SNF1-related protein kinase regulatory subunit beta-2 n=1 Tax=Quillaja saponaria TaxID=32244 RepID=A0AAD7PS50_QUISA|nr:SNF1-related protein kinase regulatory subunit beta-2 [Quillaja saponaria]
MGNVNGREEGTIQGDAPSVESNGGSGVGDNYAPNSQTPSPMASSNSIANSPPQSSRQSRSPVLFGPQVPVVPLQRPKYNCPPFFNQNRQNESHGVIEDPSQRGIPTMITWTYGGNNVAMEGSWNNWTSRKTLQRSGKDHTILLVLPSGIYRYKFFVDGEWRYIPDLPFITDEMGHVCNLLDVNDCVPENPKSVTEFEAPGSPESSYNQAFPLEGDFAKEPMAVPPQLHLTVLGMDKPDEATSTKPQHVVLDHVFIEKGLASQSLVALGLTHRFHSKYVTVVLYKPLTR